jgi:hypothetical protein
VATPFFGTFRAGNMFKRRDVQSIYELAANTTMIILDENLNKIKAILLMCHKLMFFASLNPIEQ